MKKLGLLLAAIALLWTARAEAICFADNITSYPNAYRMDWTSPDGTGHWHGDNAVYIQLHQTCGWTPHGYVTGSMRWFDTGLSMSFSGATWWNYSQASWSIWDWQQQVAYRFTINYIGPVHWKGVMEKLESNGTYSPNGTVELY
jgi:hypothetical protein